MALTADLLNQLVEDISERTADKINLGIAAEAVKLAIAADLAPLIDTVGMADEAPEDQPRNPHIPEGLRYPIAVMPEVGADGLVRTVRLSYTNERSMDTAAIQAIRAALGCTPLPDDEIMPDPTEVRQPLLPIRCAECNDPIVPSVRGWVHVFDDSNNHPHLWPRLQPPKPPVALAANADTPEPPLVCSECAEPLVPFGRGWAHASPEAAKRPHEYTALHPGPLSERLDWIAKVRAPRQDRNTPDETETPPDEQQSPPVGTCRHCGRHITWRRNYEAWRHTLTWGQESEECGTFDPNRPPGDRPTRATPR